MDYGLLGGLAEGLKQGFSSYNDAKKTQSEQAKSDAEKAMKERMLRFQSAEKGMEMDPETGEFRKSAAGIADERRKASLGLAEKGLMADFDDAGNPTNVKRIPGYQKESDPVARELQMSRLDEYRRKREEALNGKQLPPDKVLSVNEGNSIPTMLEDVRATIDANKDEFGPVKGRLGSMNPYNEKTKTINAQVRSSAQAFGRFMEGGVLRKEDEEKYAAMFPNVSDTPEVAANKLVLVDRLLKAKQTSNIAALKDAGYNITGLDKNMPVPAAPGILSQGSPQKSGSGLVKEAVAAGGPKLGETVDGFTYVGGNPSDQKSWKKAK